MFFVIFIVKPEIENLNFYKAKWLRILNAKININPLVPTLPILEHIFKWDLM